MKKHIYKKIVSPPRLVLPNSVDVRLNPLPVIHKEVGELSTSSG